MPALSIALAQINATVGDIAGNAKKILDYYQRAAKQGADLVVFPELALLGYPPEDLLLMPSFRKEAMRALKALAKATTNGPAMIVGSLYEEKGLTYNAAILLDGGKIAHVQPKTHLPNYGVFDERRWFTPGKNSKVVRWRGMKLGLLICEDIWHAEPAASLKKQGADMLIVINASPFEAGKLKHRKKAAARAKLPVVYVNLMGGQDDIVFDGGSFVLSAAGKMVVQAKEFEEALAFTLHPNPPPQGGRGLPVEETLWRAMMLGLSDYVGKNNFPGVVLGLSGGIDSAVTAAVAADALGGDRVRGVLLPSPYTSRESTEDALETAQLLGIKTTTVSITPGMKMFEETLSPLFEHSGWMEDVSIGGNVQSRLRGATLMGVTNRFGGLLLSTGNKSEIAVGYTTLYGDSCGGYNVLKDLYKTQVYTLARWRNAQSRVIPERSIAKAPTAELAPGQKDEDQLPPYDLLDRILYHHIEERRGVEEIVKLGFKRAVVEEVVGMVRLSEYKRRQSCPGVKLSPMLFGRDRRFPITNKFRR